MLAQRLIKMHKDITLNGESYEPYTLIVPKPTSDNDFTVFQNILEQGYRAYVLNDIEGRNQFLYVTNMAGDYSLVNLRFGRYDN